MRFLLVLLPCLLSAEVGIEPVQMTGPDGVRQTRFRVNTGSGYLPEQPPLPTAPPRAVADTGVLWVDRNHRYGICQSIALSADGFHAFANWYLNAQRAGYYRPLATEVPIWESPGDFAWGYGGQQIGASQDGSVLTLSSTSMAVKWSKSNRYPDWNLRYEQPLTGYSRASRDGSIVAAVQNGTLFVLDARSGDILGTEVVPEPARLQGLDISDDGQVIAVTVYDSCVIYDRTGRRTGIPIGTQNCGTQYAAALSEDGGLLVTGDFYGYVRLYRWTGSTYALRWSSSVGTPWVGGVAISADGSTIACGTGYSDGRLCVFDSSSATPLWIYQGYGSGNGAFVLSVALSADGSRIAAASWGEFSPSGTYKVFTVHNRSDSTPLVGITRDEEPGSLFACDISDDGQFAVCGGKAVHAHQMGNGGEVYAIIVGSSVPVNVGVDGIASPTRHIQVGQSVTPRATVRNTGDNTVTFPFHLVIANSADSIIYHDSTTISNLAPRSIAEAQFTQFSADTFGLYRFVFYTALPGDSYPGDDTMELPAKCFHDAMPEILNPPGAEVTINMPVTPKLVVRNNGSYPDGMRCWLTIRDSLGTPVYADSVTSSLIAPDEAATVAFRTWAPAFAGRCDATGIAVANEDFNRHNDTLTKRVTSTYEIMYDDGGWEGFYWVGRQDNDKFYVRFTPTIPTPFAITHGRIYVNMANTPFDYVMVCTGTETKPDTVSPLQTVQNVSTPTAPGWIDFDLDITRRDEGDLWMVLHWPPNSPGMGVGADATPPIDLRSFFSSNQDTFRLWTTHDWMVRLTQSPNVGVADLKPGTPRVLRIVGAAPNPFRNSSTISYEVPAAAPLQIAVFDRTGRQVAVPLNATVQPGRYELVWRGCDDRNQPLAPGVYFCRLRDTGTGRSSVRKMTLLR